MSLAKMIDFVSVIAMMSRCKGERILMLAVAMVLLVFSQGIWCTSDYGGYHNRALDLAQQKCSENKVQATIFQSNIYEQLICPIMLHETFWTT